MKHTRFPVLLSVLLLLLTACAPAAIPAAPTLPPTPAASEVTAEVTPMVTAEDEKTPENAVIETPRPAPVYDPDDLEAPEAAYTSGKELLAHIEEYESSAFYYEKDSLLYGSLCGFTLGTDCGLSISLSLCYNTLANVLKSHPHPRAAATERGFYLVYLTETGDKVFLFFDMEKSEGNLVDGYPVVQCKALDHADFSAIQAGAALSEVEAVDPAAGLYLPIFRQITAVEAYNRKVNAVSPYPYYSSMHLLTDGILQIEYEYDTEKEEFFVTKTTFSPDFTLEGAYGETCYKILPEDFANG